MQKTLKKSLLTSGAIAMVLSLPLAAPVSAQQAGSERLTIREAPTDIGATEAGIKAQLSEELDAMRNHAEEFRRGLRELGLCTANADLDGPGASVPGMLDCFVTQAISNEQILTDWSNTLGSVGTVLTDAAATYAGLAEAKTAEIEAVRDRLQALEEDRVELGRRIERVKAFVVANGAKLDGEAAHEARGLRQSWQHLVRTEDHHVKMIAIKDEARRLLDQSGQRLRVTSREAMSLRQEFADRATEEAFYIAEVGEAAQLNVALEQAAGMMTGMAKMGETIDTLRLALDEAGDTRPDPVIEVNTAPSASLLGDTSGDDDLIEFFRTVETGGRG